MAKTVKVLPRPTVEQMNEYSQLKGQLYHADLSSKETAEIAEQFRRLATSYNWTNCAFIDPDTGKFGITNAAGEVLVPAEFDDFTFLGDNDLFYTTHMAAMKDGGFGIVAADGTGKVLVEVDPKYFRPAEVEQLLGDPTKARAKLGWQPKTTLAELCAMMVEADMEQAQRDLLCAKNGFRVRNFNE